MVKKISIYVLITILGIFILNLMVKVNNNYPLGFRQHTTLIGLLGVSFGITIEWKKVVVLFKKGVHINWIILPSVLLMILAFFPPFSFIHFIFGTIVNPFMVSPLLDFITRDIIFVLSGILLIRGLTKDEDN